MKSLLATLLFAFASPALAGEVTIDAIPPDLIAQDLARTDNCDGFDSADAPFHVYDLGHEKTLYLLPCSRGAYDRFYSVYIGQQAWYDLQLFATPSYRAGWQAEEGIWFDKFDPETLELSSYSLGRGPGFCGMSGLWKWSGTSFFMLEYRMQPDCDADREPGDFPLFYKNENPPDGLLR